MMCFIKYWFGLYAYRGKMLYAYGDVFCGKAVNVNVLLFFVRVLTRDTLARDVTWSRKNKKEVLRNSWKIAGRNSSENPWRS